MEPYGQGLQTFDFWRLTEEQGRGAQDSGEGSYLFLLSILRVQGLGFGLQGLGFRVQGSGRRSMPCDDKYRRLSFDIMPPWVLNPTTVYKRPTVKGLKQTQIQIQIQIQIEIEIQIQRYRYSDTDLDHGEIEIKIPQEPCLPSRASSCTLQTGPFLCPKIVPVGSGSFKEFPKRNLQQGSMTQVP